MRYLLFIFIWLMTFAQGLEAQQFTNGSFESVSCATDCSSANSQMSCVDGWFDNYVAGVDPLQKAFCSSDLVCSGNYSILLETTSGSPGSTVKTANPLQGLSVGNMPQIVTLTVNVIDALSYSGTGIHIKGTNMGAGTISTDLVELGFNEPQQNDVCENISIVLDPSVVDFSFLHFSTSVASGSHLGGHDAVIDNVKYCGPLFDITDQCGAVTIATSDCGGAIDETYVDVYNSTGANVFSGGSFNGDPINFNVNTPGVYSIEFIVIFSDGTFSFFETTYEVLSVQSIGVATTSIWPRTCILADFTVSGNYSDCAPLTTTSVVLQFWQNGVFTGVSATATLNTSNGTWSFSGTMQNLINQGLDFGNWYDVRPVMNLSNNTSILGAEFVAGLNNDLYFADQSDPLVSVNDDPTNFNPSMTHFCEGSPIFYHGIDPLSSNHFSAIRRRPAGSSLPYGFGTGNYAEVGWVNASLNGFNGDLNAQYGTFLQVGWEYQLYIASSNTGAECIAWTPVTVEFEIVDCCAPDAVITQVPDCTTIGEPFTISVTIEAPLTAADIERIYSSYNNFTYVSHTVVETPSSLELEITFVSKVCSCEGEMLVFDIVLVGCSDPIWLMTDEIPCCAPECENTKIIDWNTGECILLNGNPARSFCIEVQTSQSILNVLAGTNNATCQVNLHNLTTTQVGSVYTICGYMEFTDPACTGHALVTLVFETEGGCCSVSQPFSFPDECVVDEGCLEIKPDIQLIYANRSTSINVSLNIPLGQTVTVIDHNAGTTQTVTVGIIKCGPFAIDQNGNIFGGSNCNGITFLGLEGIDCHRVEGVRPSIPYFFEIQWGECTWILTGDYCRETIVYPATPTDGGVDGGERSAEVDRSSFDTANGQISVFPNPVDASGLLNFDLTALTTPVKAIQITDLYGKTIESFTPDQDQQVFQHQLAQPLHQGIYFVQFHLQDGTVSSTRLVAVQ